MSSSQYWELTVGVPHDLSEGLTNLAWELGALGVVEEERPGHGATLRAFFPETIAASALADSVRIYLDALRELGFAPATDFRVETLADATALRESRVPLLVANLLSAAHRRLAAQYLRSLTPGGTLLLGGILDGEAADVVTALADHGLVHHASLSVEGWTTLELRAPLHDHA